MKILSVDEDDHYYLIRSGHSVFVQRKTTTSATEPPLRGNELLITLLCEKIINDSLSDKEETE